LAPTFFGISRVDFISAKTIKNKKNKLKEKMCDQVIFPILSGLAKSHSEFPYLFFDGVDCTGSKFPPEGEFPQWGVDLDLNNLTKIASIYVPPHAIVDIKSVDGCDLVFKGPATIPRLDSYLQKWHNADGSPCLPGHVLCGKKPNFSLKGEKKEIANVHVKRKKQWDEYLHDTASSKKDLHHNGKKIEVDWDSLFHRLCPSSKYHCECFDSFKKFAAEHPDATEKAFVNNLSNSCDPDQHYMHSKSMVGTQSETECVELFKETIRKKSFNTTDDQVHVVSIMCGGKLYSNADDNGDENQLLFDPKGDAKSEEEESLVTSSKCSSVFIYVLIGLFVFLLLFTIVYFVEDEKKIKKTKNSESRFDVEHA